ncbi:MAG TPA: hypothetical protein VF137_04085 [Candidatus Dormibacteraeota bacterium]
MSRSRRLWAACAALGATALALGVSASPVLARHGTDSMGYTMDAYGVLHPLTIGGTASPAEDSGSASMHHWTWKIARGLAEQNNHTDGLVLDGWGGLHAWCAPTSCTAPAVPSGAPYWAGWDIARGIVLLSGSITQGYILDGWGGVHPFGGAPAVTTTGYWKGWDIARGIELNPAGTNGCTQSGFVVDGWGGVHPFFTSDCTSPIGVVTTTGYWKGWDIVRGVALDNDGKTSNAGYTLDGWGGIHGWCAGTGCTPPASPSGPYWKGWDIARGLVSLGSGTGYVLDGWGGVHGYGGQADPGFSGYSSGNDQFRDMDLN